VISLQVGGGARMRLQAPYVHRAPKVAMWRVGRREGGSGNGRSPATTKPVPSLWHNST